MKFSIIKCASIGLAAASVAWAGPAAAQQAEPAAKPLTYEQAGAITAPVAEAYFNAYVGRDWDALEPLLAQDASFYDPTATRVFGPVLSEGRAAMMERFRVGYSAITHMRFEVERRFVAGDVAIYEGALDWGIDMGGGNIVESVAPMVITITTKDGKVVEHRDHIDYAPFLAALAAAQSAQ